MNSILAAIKLATLSLIPRALFNKLEIYGCFHELAHITGTEHLIPAAVWSKQLYLIDKMYFHDNSWKTFHGCKSSQRPVGTSSPHFTAICPKRVNT